MFKRKSHILNWVFTFLLIAGFVFVYFDSFAQEDMEERCQIERIEKDCEGILESECREILEKCEKYFEEKSAAIEEDITKTEQEKKTLQDQIYILTNKIKQLDYQIYQNNLMIKDLNYQIGDTQGSIDKTTLKIEESKAQLGTILREVYEQDQRSTIEILLAEETLSGFFSNLEALDSLNFKNKELPIDIKDLKAQLMAQMQSPDSEKGELESVVMLQGLQK